MGIEQIVMNEDELLDFSQMFYGRAKFEDRFDRLNDFLDENLMGKFYTSEQLEWLNEIRTDLEKKANKGYLKKALRNENKLKDVEDRSAGLRERYERFREKLDHVIKNNSLEAKKERGFGARDYLEMYVPTVREGIDEIGERLKDTGRSVYTGLRNVAHDLKTWAEMRVKWRKYPYIDIECRADLGNGESYKTLMRLGRKNRAREFNRWAEDVLEKTLDKKVIPIGMVMDSTVARIRYTDLPQRQNRRLPEDIFQNV